MQIDLRRCSPSFGGSCRRRPSCGVIVVTLRLVSSRRIPPPISSSRSLAHCVVVDCCVVIVAHRPSPHGWLLCSLSVSRISSRRVMSPRESLFSHLSRRVSLLRPVVVTQRPPLTEPHSSSLRRRRGGSGNVSHCRRGKSQRVVDQSHVDDATDNETSLSSSSSVTGSPTPPTTPPIAPPQSTEDAVSSASTPCRGSKRHP